MKCSSVFVFSFNIKFNYDSELSNMWHSESMSGIYLKKFACIHAMHYLLKVWKKHIKVDGTVYDEQTMFMCA